jgi:biotin operon repressor
MVIKDHVGQNNPVTGAEIQRQINLVDADHKKGAGLRQIINALRDKGYAICANENGYYYAKDKNELWEYIQDFQNRINEQQAACNVLIEKYNSMPESYSYPMPYYGQV